MELCKGGDRDEHPTPPATRLGGGNSPGGEIPSDGHEREPALYRKLLRGKEITRDGLWVRHCAWEGKLNRSAAVREQVLSGLLSPSSRIMRAIVLAAASA